MKDIKKYIMMLLCMVTFQSIHSMNVMIAWAIHHNYPNLAQCLIDVQAIRVMPAIVRLMSIDINERDHRGRTRLMYAAGKGYPETVRLLLAADANIDLQDTDGYTALRYAAGENHRATALILLNAGANINHRDRCGRTALMDAARLNYPEIVQLLIDFGANPTITQSDGLMAYQMVSAGDNSDEKEQNDALRAQLTAWYTQRTNPWLQ